MPDVFDVTDVSDVSDVNDLSDVTVVTDDASGTESLRPPKIDSTLLVLHCT